MRDFVFSEPVLVDVLLGCIYLIPQKAIRDCVNVVVFTSIPCADTSFVLCDKALIIN